MTPDERTSPGPPAIAVVDNVVVDGRTEPVEQTKRYNARVFRLSFPYSAIDLRSQREVRFRYRLEGFDRDWTTTYTAGSATYTNLLRRSYRFRLQVSEASHPEVISQAVVVFSKAPLIYQTWWFHAGCGAAVEVLVWAVYLIRLRQLQARFSAVLSERNRLAREMHDTVIQGCTGISALLEGMASTASDPATSAELLGYAREQTRLTIDEARQAVWNVRHEHESDVELLGAMREIAIQMAREYGRTVRVRSEANMLPMHTSAAHELLMTVREAVYSAVQHSGSESIAVQIDLSAADLTVHIVDYGVGSAVTTWQCPSPATSASQECMSACSGWVEASL